MALGALIGALRVSLSAETSAFEAGMKRSQRTAQTTAAKIKNSFGSMGGEFAALKAGVAGFVAALSVGTILAAGKAALDYAASLGETAEQLGVTTKELQNFRYAASQNGASVEEADGALGKFAISLSKAQSGSAQAQKAFKAVGVELADIETKSKSDLLGQIADKMIETGGAANNAAAGVAIFGRGFLKIVPTLNQGSKGLNELAEANARLGGVLSDTQIQNADKTADKIDDLRRVLSVQIAGVVADNAGAILDLANAIAQVAREASAAIGALRNFYNQALIAEKQAEIALSKRFDKGLLGQLGIGNAQRAKNRDAAQAQINVLRGEQTERRFSALFRGGRPRSAVGSGSPSQFLAKDGGGGGKAKKDRSAEEAQRRAERALRETNQFDQEIRRAKIDVLTATRDLATDEVERYQISVDIKDAEKSAFEAQLRYEVALNTLTKGEEGRTQVQADQLQLEYDRKDQLERDKLIVDESARAAEESARLDDLSLDLKEGDLRLQLELATTAKEARAISLRLLDISRQKEQAAIDELAASKDIAKQEEARRRQLALNSSYGNERQAVLNGTRGPLEDYMSELPSTTEKWNEALENVAANGLRSVEDGIVDVLTGAKSVGEALQGILADIISQLIRIGVQKAIVSVIGGGFAGGGYTGQGGKYEPAGIVHRGEYVFDSSSTRQLGVPFLESLRTGNVPGMAMGGFAGKLSIARTNYNERVSVSNDNGGSRGGTFNINVVAPNTGNPRSDRAAALQQANMVRGAVARSSRVNG